MKKISAILLIAVIVFSLSSCSSIAGVLPVREYNGTPLADLSYKRVDYMGGRTETYIIDFNENTVTKSTHTPYYEEGQQESNEIIKSFSEEDERQFINKIYSYGLFGIKERYEPLTEVDDGGGWSMIIRYVDGSKKESSGSNAAPRTVFNNCAIPFYDLCGERVLGNVPTTYHTPPTIDFSVLYTYKDYYFSDNGFIDFFRGNYLWNGHESKGIDLYEKAVSGHTPQLLSEEEYKLSLSTTNYNNYNGAYQRINKCVVMSYSIDPDLSDGRELLSTGWFESVELPYEPNRIYVVTLYFKNGDFVEYAFCTETLAQKIQYGKYSYNIYSEGKSSLMIYPDGSFELSPFEYFDEGNRNSGESLEALEGSWHFEASGGEEYLVLTSGSGEKLIFDYCAKALFLDSEKSTVDLSKYNLEGDHDFMSGAVTFNKN